MLYQYFPLVAMFASWPPPLPLSFPPFPPFPPLPSSSPFFSKCWTALLLKNRLYQIKFQQYFRVPYMIIVLGNACSHPSIYYNIPKQFLIRYLPPPSLLPFSCKTSNMFCTLGEYNRYTPKIYLTLA